MALLAACGSSSSGVSSDRPTGTANGVGAPDGSSAAELEAILATTQLRPGTQRVAFLLLTEESFVRAPEVTVASVYLPEDGSQPRAGETATARFHLWPYGVRASYTTDLTFDRPGSWRLDISVDYGVGFSGKAQLLLNVQERVGVPDIGSPAPLSASKTRRDVSSLEELTSDNTPDPDLYDLSIAEALASGRPLMVVFSSPSFCTSPTCGPQVDTVSALKEQYEDTANFIHVEVYDNPDEIEGDLSRGRLSPTVEEWGLNKDPNWFNESWVFVVDLDGRIAAKFEAFATIEELEAALLRARGPEASSSSP